MNSTQIGMLIPWLPAAATLLCGLCWVKKSWAKFAGAICVIATFISFLLTLVVYFSPTMQSGGTAVVHCFNWLSAGDFSVGFTYYFDHLTLLMLMVICGIGTLVCLYATGYEKGDPGYARFFAGMSLFIFSMTTLVMANNMFLFYLGWEGVGLCSYWLIGHYFEKPSAREAAKKAFIVNRVGDCAFAIGIFLTFYMFGTVHFGGSDGLLAQLSKINSTDSLAIQAIPFLLMLGAFGKSAQIPLYVWLPDAMEGPTPVSALIHAATMVTAGVYLIARLLPLFALSPLALPTVGAVGAITAIFAATIACCQYDMKRIWAYSTISQLGYMFLGVAALSTVGGVFHLLTHAFFKALLFLSAGSVMHALAGQLDIRKISGLRKKMPVTAALMGCGALALAGFPLTSGFFSKDLILGAAVERGYGPHGSVLLLIMGIVGIVAAFITAFYAFRLWFRVFMGPEKYEMGSEEHGEHTDNPPKHPHEAPWWPMNLPLVILAAGALFGGLFGLVGGAHGWVGHMISQSSANAHNLPGAVAESGHKYQLLGMPVERASEVIGGILSILGIALAAYFHWFKRDAADKVATAFKPLHTLWEHKYYIDELYDRVIVRPLWALGHALDAFDWWVVHGLVRVVAATPSGVARSLRPLQNGRLQQYGLGMVFGMGLVILVILISFAAWQ